ncbi:cytochrome bd ubiquinol oxidase subunit II [Thalassotalea insulae]|uniref:Cytochrome bd ubiquinol oxidase subunit II n=1 Tax=Thalassotalea insulae TaxID=2056778 RepID=A0ABQ6GVT5_9GAMM|nr:cytochrome d ubiquinol oxidase subunit II [Thalassotalea insulae]GLX78291.1 cytochrome bd ubiquinol oxidase subunit II [Thalassotalea insulae]
MFDQATLAIIFAGLMAFSTLVYAILDGYDLGVGMLLPLNNEKDSDTMIASIGPFWDANETWLVLAVGLLLIAFPTAHSMIFKALYLPTVFMLIGLILRGVAFDFRAKAAFNHKPTWNKAFKIGSFLASGSQGYMLGMYVMGFELSVSSIAFALLSAIGVSTAYSFIGACWLIMKTENQLQQRAIRYAKRALIISFIGISLVSATNLIIDQSIYLRWLSSSVSLLLAMIPLCVVALFVYAWRSIVEVENQALSNEATPFLACIGIFILTFLGLAISFYPFIVPNQITIWQAVSAAESLNFLLYGALFVIPTIVGYTIFSYWVFWGKVEDLRYY